METLDGTEWDIVISGTGLPQSLLALALSRSGKRILHLDRNDYYGGNEAALSLSEAEDWASKHAESQHATPGSSFSYASVTKPEVHGPIKIGSSRAYALALAPQLVYARSNLAPTLVSSRTHNQLEFQAVGSWFLVDSDQPSRSQDAKVWLTKVPNGREDIFQDATLDLKAKRSLMKFIRYVGNHEEQEDWPTARQLCFVNVLVGKFGLPVASHQPLQALSLVHESDIDTSTHTAISNISRHLRSMGIFGPGFSAVLPKWGGLAEVAQVACRACAVGGGVYVLNKGIDQVSRTATDGLSLTLSGGEKVMTKWLVGSHGDIPSDDAPAAEAASHNMSAIARSISIVSSPLTALFPRTSEGGVVPAGAVVHVPQGFSCAPVNILVHSSESGECPSNQCVLYASVAVSRGFGILEDAVNAFLRSVGEQPAPEVLWKLHYTHEVPKRQPGVAETAQHQGAMGSVSNHVVILPPLSTDLALQDDVLDDVKAAWMKITGEGEEGFMKFDAREGTGEDE